MTHRQIGFLVILLNVAAVSLFGQVESHSEAAEATESAQPAATEDLRRMFQSPPAEFRPLVITHSHLLNVDDPAKLLQQRHAGGTVLDAGVKPGSKDISEEPWNNPTYLNDPGQFAKLRKLLSSLQRAGQRIWLYDELGYPSASAGGRVVTDHPEYQVEVVGCRTWVASGAEPVEVTPEHPKVVACYALPRRAGALDLDAATDLTERARAGQFRSAPPEGEWSVCLFERFYPDTWRRHNIPRRNVNILDRRAVSRFIELTHEKYAKELGTQLSDVDAFFTDEPQFGSSEHWTGGKKRCVPMVQWCDELPNAFRRSKGYELSPVLPAIFHSVGPRTSKYRYDFYDVQSELVAENYFGQIESWCHDHQVASSGHMLLEESLLFHVMFSGSMLKNWARMDLPGVDLLGATPYRTMAHWEGDVVSVAEDFSCKLASSVAHLTSKQGVFTESFALARDASVRQVLGIAAWQFAGGVTHMSTYTVQESLSPTDYAALSDFTGRLAVLARRGRHVADVAVVVPEASVWATYTPPDGAPYRRYFTCNPGPTMIDRVFRDTCFALASRQRDYDCLGEHLLEKAQLRDGCLCLADESFRVLILPEMRMLREESLRKMLGFLESGGFVALVGSLPCQSPQIGDDPDRTSNVQKLLARFSSQTVHLADPADLSRLVPWIDRHVPPAVNWDGSSAVRMLRRREPGRDILLIANPSDKAASGHVTAPGAGEASQWDPETGMTQSLGRVTVGQAVALEIPAESARFLLIESLP